MWWWWLLFSFCIVLVIVILSEQPTSKPMIYTIVRAIPVCANPVLSSQFAKGSGYEVHGKRVECEPPVIDSVHWVDPYMISRAREWRIQCRLEIRVPRVTFSFGSRKRYVFHSTLDVPVQMDLVDTDRVHLARVERNHLESIMSQDRWYPNDKQDVESLIDIWLASICAQGPLNLHVAA
jgi:hypothetical protein